VQGLLFGFAISLVGLLIGFYLFQWMLRRYGKRWRVPAQENWAALVVLLFVLSLLGVPAEPIANTFSRQQEHAADVFGQEAVHGIVADPQATAQAAFQLLGENSYADPFPSPLLEFWTYSHPAVGFRAAFAKHYDPWVLGAAPKYFKK
jgi:Zn-dependent protease with chaperone function